MDFSSLTNSKKLTIIDGLIEQTLLDVYRYGLSLNLSVESLSPTWTAPEDHEMNQEEVDKLLESLDRLRNLQERRASIA